VTLGSIGITATFDTFWGSFQGRTAGRLGSTWNQRRIYIISAHENQ